jgi:pimeloyl-ACP methyl ester carboxylesterase
MHKVLLLDQPNFTISCSVHGAWADGSSWNKIIPLLEEKGVHVTAVHLPFTTLADDVAAVKRTLALRDGPVPLVGHSYGGAVITEAGNDPKAATLVYVAAFAPDAGQSAGDLNNEYPAPPGDKEFRPDANGFLRRTDEGIAEDFAQDLLASEAKILAAIQGQVSGPNELGVKVTTAAWRNKPSFYIVADHDRMLYSTATRSRRTGRQRSKRPRTFQPSPGLYRRSERRKLFA